MKWWSFTQTVIFYVTDSFWWFSEVLIPHIGPIHYRALYIIGLDLHWIWPPIADGSFVGQRLGPSFIRQINGDRPICSIRIDKNMLWSIGDRENWQFRKFENKIINQMHNCSQVHKRIRHFRHGSSSQKCHFQMIFSSAYFHHSNYIFLLTIFEFIL